MNESTNAERANRGAYMLEQYGAEYGEDEDATMLRDLLADLLHLCARDGVSFDDALYEARRHNFAERYELPRTLAQAATEHQQRPVSGENLDRSV